MVREVSEGAVGTRGTWQTIAPKRALPAVGRASMLPVSRPPFEPPWQPSFAAEVTPREIRSFATASKSSYALLRFSLSAAYQHMAMWRGERMRFGGQGGQAGREVYGRAGTWCQRGPYSPPPRMLACTYA